MPVIRARRFGTTKDLIPSWAIELPESPVTLRSLIEIIVRSETSAFVKRRSERELIKLLTEKEIREGAARGKIDMGGHEPFDQVVDVNLSIEAALQAFEDGLYFVFIDEIRQTQLDQPLEIRDESVILFVRLVLLTGG